MNKPTPNIIHEDYLDGRRSIISLDDYERLVKYCDSLKKLLFKAGERIYDQPILEKEIEDILD